MAYKMFPASTNSCCSRGATWSDKETKALLDIWCDRGIQYQLAMLPRKKAVFVEIATRLTACGYQRTWEQCRWRIRNLKREYYKSAGAVPGPNSANCTSGKAVSSRKQCRFFKELDQVMRAKQRWSATPSLIKSADAASSSSVVGSPGSSICVRNGVLPGFDDFALCALPLIKPKTEPELSHGEDDDDETDAGILPSNHSEPYNEAAPMEGCDEDENGSLVLECEPEIETLKDVVHEDAKGSGEEEIKQHRKRRHEATIEKLISSIGVTANVMMDRLVKLHTESERRILAAEEAFLLREEEREEKRMRWLTEMMERRMQDNQKHQVQMMQMLCSALSSAITRESVDE